jgi:hypothetical protein
VKTELRLIIKPPALYWIKSASLTKVQAFASRLNQGKFKEDFTRLFQINSASRLDKTSWGFL